MNIIELAKQVGYPIQHEEWRNATEEFAALVAAAARADEREECAKLCEAIGNTQANMNAAWRSGCRDAATEIRARGTT
jgi:hypothetical protein